MTGVVLRKAQLKSALRYGGVVRVPLRDRSQVEAARELIAEGAAEEVGTDGTEIRIVRPRPAR